MFDSRARGAALCAVAVCLTMLVACGVSNSSMEISPSSVLLLPGQSFQFTIGASSAQPPPTLLVNGVAGGSASAGTINPEGLYTAPSSAPAQPVTLSIQGQKTSSVINIVPLGSFSSSVSPTQNPLVADYSINAPAGAPVQVQFGTDTNYAFSTSPVQVPGNGGNVTVLVAGMRAATTYHMRAVTNLSQGAQSLDQDHTFTTGSIPVDRVPVMSTQLPGNGSPSPGVELLSLIPLTSGGNLLSTVATDLEGNVIWYYDLMNGDLFPEPVKLLPNGHMLVLVSTAVNEIREIDLAGNVINLVTIPQVDQAISGAADFQISTFSHDVAVLPNGHWILLVDFSKTISNTAGVPDGTVMNGNALIDWDVQKGTAGWIWSTFDHLDLTRAPYGYPDWSHANAVIYSPDDGNLIFSMRNQNWIIKINYGNGTGDGSVLWRLGPGGDFTFPSGQAPIEYNYGQHYPTILSPNSSGVISLMFFNNGNNRLVDGSDDLCGQGGFVACYSSVPIVQLNESTKEATVLWEDILLPAYSICCGDAQALPNGNYEFDVAFDVLSPNFSHIEEVDASQQLVWQLNVEGQLAYRGFRIPSLYPGQIWPATAATTASQVPPRKASKAQVKTLEQLP